MADGDNASAEGERRRGFAWQEDDTFLRKVELNVLIPKKVREKARKECHVVVDAFTVCCAASGLSMVYKCRKENTALQACLGRYFNDKEFFEGCKQEYLAERKEYRETGISKKARERAAKAQAT